MRGIEDISDGTPCFATIRPPPTSEQHSDPNKGTNYATMDLDRFAFLLFDNLDRTQWPQKISESRGAYDALKAHFLKYINHPDDLESTVDPLADDEESPWQTLRRDEQMRADISQDVDRCLQENFFFREPATKEKMIDILFIYSKLNPDLGYRQGMHELLAPILWVVDKDAVETKSLEGAGSTGEGDDFLLQLLSSEHRSANGQMDVVPIVNQCHHIHNELLMTTDLELADHLQALEILPQIFLTRWLRLLFGREFPFQNVLVVWDVLFSEGLRPELIDFVCVAMLLRIRWQLLEADASTAFTILLRYPSPHPHEPQSFVRDAVYLEQNPTPDRGAFIISKYSGKPPDSSKRFGQSHAPSFSGIKSHLRGDLWDTSEGSSPSRSPARDSPKGLEALFQDVSEGIQRRTESWGVAKAVRGAVSEAKKNMQTIQAEHYSRQRYDEASSAHTSGASYTHNSDAVIHLKTKIEALEARNQMLAKTLSQALNDIRSRMLKAEGLDTTTAHTVKQALTKVQSVQTCLENPSSPLASGGRTPNAAADTDSDKISGVLQPAGGKPEDETSSSNKAPPVAAEPPAKSPTSPVGNDFKSRSRPHIPSSVPLRHATRPSLADSEFSWMLGGNRPLSSFVSPASVPPEQTRHGETKGKPNNLFGNGDDELRRADADLDGLALRSLRGPKGGE
ncbi:hypothetical protein N8T08_001544 [Aspergillus melleus]|uniref:Uncharacterized protein n=1 Tax=Aspergillus melleus TaxID=138277 RepID=A0ACC3B9Y9_9EURO|nr:hypothetical protein N8T08_001544 [Aspergillus melleus]